MEPVIERGDVIFVERASYDLEKGFPKKHRIYLINHDNDFFFRYLSHHVRPDQTGTLVVTSEDRSSGMDFIDLPMDPVKAAAKIEKVVIGHVVYITKKRP
jgi:signal peptidase I